MKTENEGKKEEEKRTLTKQFHEMWHLCQPIFLLELYRIHLLNFVTLIKTLFNILKNILESCESKMLFTNLC